MYYVIVGFSNPNIYTFTASCSVVCGTAINWYFDINLEKSLKFKSRLDADKFIKTHNLINCCSYGVDY